MLILISSFLFIFILYITFDLKDSNNDNYTIQAIKEELKNSNDNIQEKTIKLLQNSIFTLTEKINNISSSLINIENNQNTKTQPNEPNENLDKKIMALEESVNKNITKISDFLNIVNNGIINIASENNRINETVVNIEEKLNTKVENELKRIEDDDVAKILEYIKNMNNSMIDINNNFIRLYKNLNEFNNLLKKAGNESPFEKKEEIVDEEDEFKDTNENKSNEIAIEKKMLEEKENLEKTLKEEQKKQEEMEKVKKLEAKLLEAQLKEQTTKNIENKQKIKLAETKPLKEEKLILEEEIKPEINLDLPEINLDTELLSNNTDDLLNNNTTDDLESLISPNKITVADNPLDFDLNFSVEVGELEKSTIDNINSSDNLSFDPFLEKEIIKTDNSSLDNLLSQIPKQNNENILEVAPKISEKIIEKTPEIKIEELKEEIKPKENKETSTNEEDDMSTKELKRKIQELKNKLNENNGE